MVLFRLIFKKEFYSIYIYTKLGQYNTPYLEALTQPIVNKNLANNVYT